MKKFLLLVMISLIPLTFLSRCKKDKGDPPELPPYGSMVIDFSNFASGKKAAEINGAVKGTESSTWEFAATLAGTWNTLISTSLEIPMAAFEAASGYKPSFVSEKLWQWKYDFTSGANTYKARLQGKISGTTVTWKMYITYEGTGGYTDFIWIEGTSSADGSGGQWKFRQSPVADVSLFQDDWTMSGDEVTGVKYTYTKSGSYQGSYISYLLLSSGSFDSSYSIHFADGSYADSEIEWNISTRDGRLKCVDYLQDDNWYCWDTNRINKLCD